MRLISIRQCLVLERKSKNSSLPFMTCLRKIPAAGLGYMHTVICSNDRTINEM